MRYALCFYGRSGGVSYKNYKIDANKGRESIKKILSSVII